MAEIEEIQRFNYETIPLSVLKEIKKEISDMYPNFVDEKGYRLIRKSDVLNILDKYISRKDDK